MHLLSVSVYMYLRCITLHIVLLLSFCGRFHGVPFRSTVLLQPTTNCLVNLTEQVCVGKLSQFVQCMCFSWYGVYVWGWVHVHVGILYCALFVCCSLPSL